MITDDEESLILGYAYVPEHLPGYVTSILNVEPFLISNYLCYLIKKHMIFVGYPLGEDFEESKLRKALDSSIGRFKPDSVALISPEALFSPSTCKQQGSDDYYKLELATLKIDKNVRNMLRRASRDLRIERSRTMGKEHEKLISNFFQTHDIDKPTKKIFEKIPAYVSQSKTSLVLNALNESGTLAAFDVVDLASKDHAFYQFNFVSGENYVPGSSDLLFSEIVKIAGEAGKKYVNMGLGISEGVRRFKEKWGGVPFLKHEFCLYSVGGYDVMEDVLF